MIPPEKRADLCSIILGDYRPVAFIGSGLSQNYCDWISFLKKLMERSGCQEGMAIFHDYENGKAGLDDLLLVADGAVKKLLPAGLQYFMQETFRATDDADIPSAYRAIVHAPFAFYLTTNYDTNIEDAYYVSHGKRLNVVLPDHADEALRYMQNQIPFVLKIHGCARAGGSFVIGHEDYQKVVYSNRDLRYILASILATRPIVFMGYGYRDPHINRYLEYERIVLSRGGMRKLTFCRKGDTPLSMGLRLQALGISLFELEEWSEIADILNQLTFIRIRDHYQRCRKEFKDEFSKFVRNSRKECAWGALLYAYASSDIGYGEDIRRIFDAVKENKILRQEIESKPLFNLVFRTISGQMFKTSKLIDEAKQQFEIASEVARQHSEILPPLRALALRYAGIVHLIPYPKKRKAKDIDKAAKLFKEASEVLGKEFPHEELDILKWEAMLLAEKKEHEKASRRFIEVAEKAKNLNYSKNEAWCRYNAINQLVESNIVTKTKDINALDELEKTQVLFEELDHLRGLGETHFLFAKIYSYYYKDHKKVETKNKLVYHLKKANAISEITEDKRLQQRCSDFLSSLDA